MMAAGLACLVVAFFSMFVTDDVPPPHVPGMSWGNWVGAAIALTGIGLIAASLLVSAWRHLP